jgi:hypothetical protein
MRIQLKYCITISLLRSLTYATLLDTTTQQQTFDSQHQTIIQQQTFVSQSPETDNLVNLFKDQKRVVTGLLLSHD